VKRKGKKKKKEWGVIEDDFILLFYWLYPLGKRHCDASRNGPKLWYPNIIR
jgi:hypothetical protein